MEVKPGYKQTEVGVIPEDWGVVSAFEACSKIQDGTHFSPRSGGNDYLYVTSKNVRFGYLDLSTAGWIDAAQHQAIYRRCDVKKGDLLLTKDGANTGNAALNNLAEEFSLLSSVAFLRFNLSKHCAAYFLQQVLTSQGQRQIQDAMAGNAITRLTLEKINKLRFPIPPTRAEQDAIAEALSDADALIESVEQLLAKKCQLKQGAMQELLTGKKRLPGFESKPGYKQTEVGVIPEDWGLEFIENLAQITTGSRNTQDRVADGQHPFFVRSQIVERINSYSFDGEAVLTAGDGVGTGKVFHYINGKFDAHQRVYRISEFSERINGYFFYLYFSSHFYGRIMQMTAKSSVDSVRREMIARMLIPLPPTKAEQVAIARTLSDMDAEIAALETKLVKARQLKQGMMQEMLTGRIRLVEPDANVGRLPLRHTSVRAPTKSHNWQINEAVVISVLAKSFGSEQWPLGRKRYTKLSYLLHRYAEGQAEGYLKKAAGPYNPATKYKGPEEIALKKGYVRRHTRDKFSGFVAAEKIGEAESYFAKWYGKDVLAWLDQFRRKSNDELELLATVDMAMVDLRSGNKAVQLADVKRVIRDHPEWEAKLDRATFSDDKISQAMKSCRQLLGFEE
jgi:type I restriction enzyme S subunit